MAVQSPTEQLLKHTEALFKYVASLRVPQEPYVGGLEMANDYRCSAAVDSRKRKLWELYHAIDVVSRACAPPEKYRNIQAVALHVKLQDEDSWMQRADINL